LYDADADDIGTERERERESHSEHRTVVGACAVVVSIATWK